MRFVLLLLLIAPSIHATLDPAKSLNAYLRRTWDIDNGLPNNSITAMVQAPDGYIWFGTDNGLARFDGRNFTLFDKQHYSGLLSNQISSLTVDQDENLWVGTRGGGVSRFRNGQFDVFLSQNGVAGNSVSCLKADSKGNVWIGTENSGLVRFRGGVFQTYTTASGLVDNSIVALASDSNGALWIATSSGLNIMEHGKLLPVVRNDSSNAGFIRTLYLDRHHTLWLGTNGFGLMAWQPGKTEYSAAYTSRQGLSDNTVSSIFQDSAGTLWVGTPSGSLNRIANGRVTSVQPHGTRGGGVSNILEDREGGLWVASSTRGVACYRNRTINTLAREAGLPSETILPVFEDSKQSLWVGTNQGLARIRPGGGTDRFGLHQGLPDLLISSVAEDGNGNIWVGTPQGLARFGGKHFVPVPEQPGLQPGFVHCLLADRNGDMWIGSRNGLTHYAGHEFITYTTQDGLPDNHILALHQSRDGAIWIGTDGGGAAVLREGKFTSYTAQDGLPSQVILAVSEDTEGNILLGTSGGGMVRFANGRFTTFGSAQGFPDDIIYQIIDDHRGQLWLSCSKGIFSVVKAGLAGTHGRSAYKLECRLYGTGDGMATRECNGGFQPAGALTHDGRIWFPTAAGLSVLNPSELYENTSALGVNIERVAVNGKWIPAADHLNLKSGDNSLTFQFAAPTFSFSGHPQYRYWLTGMEEEWSAPTSDQTARYTNIPPGDYEFRVAASRDGQNWLSEAQPVSVDLAPAYYQTTQFYVGLISFALALFYWMHLRRVHALRRQASGTLAKKVSAETAIIKIESGPDLLRLNASLEAQAQLLLTDHSPERADPMEPISFSLPALMKEVTETVTLRAEAKGVTFKAGAFPDSIDHVVGDQKKLKQILLNLLDNAIEFTPRGIVGLRVVTGLSAQMESLLHFSISDTSMGLLPSEFKKAFQACDEPEKATAEAFEGSARRLYDAIRLARRMGGELWVESKPGVGNTFHFTARLAVTSSSALMLLEASVL